MSQRPLGFFMGITLLLSVQARGATVPQGFLLPDDPKEMSIQETRRLQVEGQLGNVVSLNGRLYWVLEPVNEALGKISGSPHVVEVKDPYHFQVSWKLPPDLVKARYPQWPGQNIDVYGDDKQLCRTKVIQLWALALLNQNEEEAWSELNQRGEFVAELEQRPGCRGAVWGRWSSWAHPERVGSVEVNVSRETLTRKVDAAFQQHPGFSEAQKSFAEAFTSEWRRKKAPRWDRYPPVSKSLVLAKDVDSDRILADKYVSGGDKCSRVGAYFWQRFSVSTEKGLVTEIRPVDKVLFLLKWALQVEGKRVVFIKGSAFHQGPVFYDPDQSMMIRVDRLSYPMPIGGPC